MRDAQFEFVPAPKVEPDPSNFQVALDAQFQFALDVRFQIGLDVKLKFVFAVR